MPPKKMPGVYVQVPVSPGQPIAGVSTSTTAFVGPTLAGPIGSPPALLTSYANFEQIYGGSDDLGFAPHLNHIAHGVRAFFAEGGARLYVVRVAHPSKTAAGTAKVAPTLADYKKAFRLLSDLPDVSIVAAPGHTAFPAPIAKGVAGQLVAHAEELRYRIAVLDTPPGQTPADAKTWKGNFDSKFAALYYPWIVVANPSFRPANPVSSPAITLPPSAFMCGIYARTDAARGVFKAPANVPVQSALRFERVLTTSDQADLNVLGINCLRAFTGRGNLVWGARTISSDPEWKYINVRRYDVYLERSIDLGTQWVVFEPNAEPTWANVRTLVTNFLLNEWRSGALQGTKTEQAFFVQCGLGTSMSQNDLDNGQLICEVGFAPIQPAEFFVFRIGQKMASTTA